MGNFPIGPWRRLLPASLIALLLASCAGGEVETAPKAEEAPAAGELCAEPEQLELDYKRHSQIEFLPDEITGDLQKPAADDLTGKMGPADGLGGSSDGRGFAASVEPPSPQWRATMAFGSPELWAMAEEDARRLSAAQSRDIGSCAVRAVCEHQSDADRALVIYDRQMAPMTAQMPQNAAAARLTVEYRRDNGVWRPVTALDEKKEPFAGALQMLKR